MGLLLALVLLTDQLDNKAHARIIRIGALAAGSNSNNLNLNVNVMSCPIAHPSLP